MNSSTKPPLPASKKFHFEVDFELEEERRRIEAEHHQEIMRQKAMAEAEASKIITYSEEEVSVFRTEAESAGYARGLSDAKKSIEQVTHALVEKMVHDIDLLIAQEESRNRDSQKIAASVAVATLKKTWPQLLEKYGYTKVEDAIRHALELNSQETRIVIRVHDSMLDTVVSRLPKLKEHEAFAGKVIVLADDAVAAGDCKVEWADGGLEVLGRSIMQNLDEALARVMSGTFESKSHEHDNT